ncbi:NAD-dependent protein deacetylase [Desulfovibrio sp. An276]|uniref:NAD-dependent protein deacetylase n=1 Tax=Desulfovibrio sp. An276 TaxID=1965618 RepID=UPI000B382046|nr:NAD-dependent protein deacetylase [Desulfovibrio sp. An276]OUO51902.1 NAD-dependent protein deacetylase [Desulfovibrio sp. An276]
MSFYEDLVIETQGAYTRYHQVYAAGGTPYELSTRAALPYTEQIAHLVREIKEADCVLVGGASGLSAAGGGDFYYEDNASFRKYFGKFAEKYHLKGAFDGTMRRWDDRKEFWGYLATFLYTTQTAPVRSPYLDLDVLLRDKDFFVLTTNQDTQFLKLYPENMVAEIQGDHRFFQCSVCCTDTTWDALKPVEDMITAMGEGTSVPEDLIPRCPHCGREAFPWVRGYGNFLTGAKYEEEYEKVSQWLFAHKDQKILFLELGVGRLTPMFIQEPFWYLTLRLPNARYIAVNNKYNFLPRVLEDRGMVIVEDLARVLADAHKLSKQDTRELSPAGGNHVAG